MRKTKKYMVLLLIGVLMLNLLPTAALAQENSVMIDPGVEGVTAPVTGQMPALEGITLPETAEGVQISRILWQEYNVHGTVTANYGADYLQNQSLGTAFAFREEHIYSITVELKIAQENLHDHVFSGKTATVNGEPVDPLTCQSGRDWASFTYFFDGRALYQVELTGVQEPQPGQTASFEGITLGEDAQNYQIYSITWMQTNNIALTTDEYTQVIGGEVTGEPFVFAEGYAYSLRVILQTQDGYMFNAMVRPFINGEDYAMQYTDGTQCQLIRIWNAQSVGGQQQLLVQPAVEGVQSPVIGEETSFEQVVLPEGAEGYRIAALIWQEYDLQGQVVDSYAIHKVGGYADIVGHAFTFREGFRYSLKICLETEMMYRFNQDGPDYYGRSFLINGQKMDPLHCEIGLGYADATCYFGFTQAESLQIFGTAEPQTDRFADFEDITVSEGYVIRQLTWTEYDHVTFQSRQYSFLPETGAYLGEQIQFRQGCSYGLRISVGTTNGELFASDTAITVDGAEVTRTELRQQGADVVMVWNADGSAAQRIDQVQLQIQPILGQFTAMETVKVPAGCKLLSVGFTETDPNGQMTRQWVTNLEGAESFKEPIGEPFVFRKGYGYSVMFVLGPDTGYCFDDMPQLLVNGQPVGMGQVQSCYLEGSAVLQAQPPQEPVAPDVHPPHGDPIMVTFLLMAGSLAGLLALAGKKRYIS